MLIKKIDTLKKYITEKSRIDKILLFLCFFFSIVFIISLLSIFELYPQFNDLYETNNQLNTEYQSLMDQVSDQTEDLKKLDQINKEKKDLLSLKKDAEKGYTTRFFDYIFGNSYSKKK